MCSEIVASTRRCELLMSSPALIKPVVASPATHTSIKLPSVLTPSTGGCSNEGSMFPFYLFIWWGQSMLMNICLKTLHVNMPDSSKNANLLLCAWIPN